MNKKEFEIWVENNEEIYEVIEDCCEELESESNYDGDWTIEVENIYYHKHLKFVFKHSYKKSSSGNCCDTWDEKIELLENYFDGKLDKDVETVYGKLNETFNIPRLLLNDCEVEEFKIALKLALKQIQN